MPTIIVDCVESQSCPTSFADYNASKLKLKARSDRMFFRLCGSPEICYTVEQEICDAIDAGTLKVLPCGKIDPGTPTAVTETDDHGCEDTTVTTGWTFDLEAYFWYHPDNEDFFASICDGIVAEFGWICCDGLVWIPDTEEFDLSAVGPVDDNGFKKHRVTANWTQKCGVLRSIPARSPLV